MMKQLKQALPALGLALAAYLTPQQDANAETIQLFMSEEASVGLQLQGAAHTSDSKIGVGGGSFHIYDNDLTNGRTQGGPGHTLRDAGSWDNNYVLLSEQGGILKIDLSTGFLVDDTPTTGTGLDITGISRMFEYNGIPHFSGIDANTDTIKFFEWGNNTPVAMGPYIGPNHTGLEAAITGPVTDLDKVSLLVGRERLWGDTPTIDQYYGGSLVSSFMDANAFGELTDLTYNAADGVLTGSYTGGRLVNYPNFSEHVIPEPATTGALIGLGALAAAAAYRSRRKSGE